MPSLTLFLSFCIPKFPIYIIFLLWRTSFSFSFMAGLLETNSIFIYLRKSFFLLQFWRRNLMDTEFQVGVIFSLNTLSILVYTLLACMVSEEKSNIILLLVSLQVRCFFPVPSFKVFSLPLTSKVWIQYTRVLIIWYLSWLVFSDIPISVVCCMSNKSHFKSLSLSLLPSSFPFLSFFLPFTQMLHLLEFSHSSWMFFSIVFSLFSLVF